MSGIQQMLLAGGRPKIQMAYQAAGAGNVAAGGSGAIDLAFPTGITYGDILVAHVVAEDATTAGITTPSGWTIANTQTNGSTFVSRLFWKIASGLESGVESFTVANSVGAWGRMYRLNRGSAIESAGGQLNTGSSTTMPCTDVTSTRLLAVALQAFYAKINTTIGNVTGESGGDYTEAVAEYATGGATSGILSLQVATLAAAGSITGGSATLGSAGTNRATHACVFYP